MLLGELFPLTVGTIIDKHENISKFHVVSGSQEGILPGTGEIQAFYIGFILSLIVVGSGIIIGKKYMNYEKIHIGLFFLLICSFIISEDAYASNKVNSDMNFQLFNQITRIKNVNYPKFDAVDFKKKRN